MCESSAEVIKPLLLGCDTKQSKIIQICLTSVQKVIEAKILNLVNLNKKHKQAKSLNYTIFYSTKKTE